MLPFFLFFRGAWSPFALGPPAALFCCVFAAPSCPPSASSTFSLSTTSSRAARLCSTWSRATAPTLCRIASLSCDTSLRFSPLSCFTSASLILGTFPVPLVPFLCACAYLWDLPLASALSSDAVSPCCSHQRQRVSESQLAHDSMPAPPLVFYYALLWPLLRVRLVCLGLPLHLCSQFAIRRQGMTLKLASEYTSVFPVTTCWAYVHCIFYWGGGRSGWGVLRLCVGRSSCAMMPLEFPLRGGVFSLLHRH